ncbi:uncharacterized protein LOC132584036 [Heteronotia binoei]|uniref:uncharacterized protein LOC132584036 n=1 Tax=Heteronotia binoei TaxID=13085 RepID=UPI00292EE166|nr:uncharacterized protein LOC132584036 [Heteronotia binoei]
MQHSEAHTQWQDTPTRLWTSRCGPGTVKEQPPVPMSTAFPGPLSTSTPPLPLPPPLPPLQPLPQDVPQQAILGMRRESEKLNKMLECIQDLRRRAEEKCPDWYSGTEPQFMITITISMYYVNNGHYVFISVLSVCEINLLSSHPQDGLLWNVVWYRLRRWQWWWQRSGGVLVDNGPGNAVDIGTGGCSLTVPGRISRSTTELECLAIACVPPNAACRLVAVVVGMGKNGPGSRVDISPNSYRVVMPGAYLCSSVHCTRAATSCCCDPCCGPC